MIATRPTVKRTDVIRFAASESIQHGDRINFNTDVVGRELSADDRVDRIILSEELVVDIDLFAFEGEPIAGV